MGTTEKRITITVSDDMYAAISAFAKYDGVPIATKAAELLREIIEIKEDELLAEMVAARDTKDAKFISHEEVWKSPTT